MKFLNLTILLLMLPLAGCLGVPEGAIGIGDRVSATVTVEDLDSGEIIMLNQPIDFVVGTGSGGLGFEFERRLIGKDDAYSGELRIRSDPSIDWERQVKVVGVFEDDLIGTIDDAQFRQFFGEPVVDSTFEPEFSFYTFRVVGYEAPTVTYRVEPVDGQENPVEYLGATLVTTINYEHDTMIQTLVANVGETFQVQPPSSFNPSTPLGLEPGSYRSAGNEDDKLVYDYSSSSNPAVIGRDLTITVTVRNVVPGVANVSEPVNGNYGVRTSPVVNGQASSEPDYSA